MSSSGGIVCGGSAAKKQAPGPLRRGGSAPGLVVYGSTASANTSQAERRAEGTDEPPAAGREAPPTTGRRSPGSSRPAARAHFGRSLTRACSAAAAAGCAGRAATGGGRAGLSG
jgi:hypothetical protein